MNLRNSAFGFYFNPVLGFNVELPKIIKLQDIMYPTKDIYFIVK